MDNGDRRTVKGKRNFRSTLAVAAGAALATLRDHTVIVVFGLASLGLVVLMLRT